jgi:nitroreductase
MRLFIAVLSLTLLFVPTVVAQEPAVPVAQETSAIVELLRPVRQGGKPLMQALAERRSEREFSREALAPQMLSNLLWAAFGVSRPDGRRTAPTARNRQDMDVYVALAEGLYLYEAKEHHLKPVVKGDLRALTGTQPFVGEAALNLIYVAPIASGAGEEAFVYAGAHAGFISENVYLFCASEGLATVVRASIDREALARAMRLPADRRIILAQTVGVRKQP